jgi:amino acid adenylation domain-containing protein
LQSKAELEAQTMAQLELETAVKGEFEELKERVLASDQLQDKENIEDIYPMSAIEKGMVFAALFSKTQGVYHDQFVYRKTFANFDAERFRQALELLTVKHSILRTGFLLNQEADVQVVYKKIPVTIEQQDLRQLASGEQQKFIRDYLVAQLSHPFEVSKAPLWRMTMFNLGQNEYAFAWQFHHAILDGWSNASFITELNNLYLQLAGDAGYQPALLRAGYKDFVIQQEIDRRDEAVKKFWRNELSEFTRLDLFTEEETLVEHSVAYDSNYVKKLRKAAVELNTTVKGLSFSAFLYLMKVLNYDKEVLVGLVTNTRPQTEDGDKILGCFLNTIPVRMVIDEKQQYRDFVNKVTNKLVELKKYEKLSTPDIATVTGQRSKTGNPFFDVYFDYVDFHIYKTAKNESDDNATSLFSKERTNTYFDFDITSNDDAYVVRLRLARKLKSGLTLQRIAALYNRILEAFISTPTKLLNQTEYLGDEEKQKILYEFNGPQAAVPSGSIASIIQNHALTQPNAVAVKYNDASITYRQLNENSNRMARFMKQHASLKPDDIVAIITERNDNFISNVLAVWKAGAAYLPIDPEDPIERINTIIADARPALVITDNAAIHEAITSIFIPAIHDQLQLQDASDLEQSFTDNDLAYVIYTSGSTGVPKGAMVEHIGMLNHLYAKVNDLKIGKQSVIAQNASQCFDISVWQSFAALVTGGTTVVYDKNTILNPSRFINMVEEDEVSLLELVPSYLFMLMELIESGQVSKPAFSKLQFMILTGEALKHPLLEKWFRHYASIPVMNAYGPTEASDDITHCIMQSLPANINVPVGKPVQNFNIYIVNDELQLCPLGVKGEIVVSGLGVGRGYLNNPAKTQAVFMEDPFFKGRRMYKTGDLGRMLDDGNIEFFGRKDYQLKIKGFRIELEEIEVNLNLCPEIKEGVIIDKKDEQGEPYLVAYYTADNEAEIKPFLRERLPHYMIPSYFVRLDKLPLTPNGKIDRKALKQYEITGGASQEHIEPTTELEKELVELWKEMFNKEKISTTDNFFELGGDSFKAIRLVSKSNKFSVPDLYAHPTIGELARFMLTNTNDSNSLLSLMLDVKEHAELSFIGIPNSAGDPFSFNETVTYLQQYTDNLNFYGTKLPRTAPAENETMTTMLEVLGQAIVAEVREKIKTPLVIFGQCNGSVLALKVAELLQKESFDVRAVCVGGILPPKRTNYKPDSRTNNDILEFIKSLDASIPNDPNDLEFFLKHFRYDSDLAKAGFNYFTEAISGKSFDKFRMPFYFITGNRDPLTKGYKLKYKRWRNYADNVNLVVIDKVGHYILRDAAGDLAKIMKQVAETVVAR